MSEYSILEKVGQIAGIGGLSLGVLLLIFKEILRKNIFPSLNRKQAYSIIKLIIILTFVVAIAGIMAWVWSETFNNKKIINDVHVPEQDNFRRIYFQGFDDVPTDELNQMWLKGASGDWRGELLKSEYRICNISQSESASFTSTFRFIKSEGHVEDLSNSKVTVKVKIEPPNAKYSSAGILFRKVSTKPDYYAFVLNSGNSVSLMRRSGNSMKVLWSKEIIENSKDVDTVKLSVIGNGNELKMYINDQFIGEEIEENISYGNPGVFAYSKGCFEFDEFSLFQRYD